MALNANESVYGPIADHAANKYGIPPSIFRSLIMSESSFDPYALNKSGASGIAQFMPKTAAALKIDPFNPMDALDAAAGYLSKNYKKYGNWQDAISQYKGFSDLTAGYAKAQEVLDNAVNNFGGSLVDQIPGQSPDVIAKAAKDAATAKAQPLGPFWMWSVSDWKSFLSNSAYGFMIGIVGVVFVVGSIWVLINKSK